MPSPESSVFSIRRRASATLTESKLRSLPRLVLMLDPLDLTDRRRDELEDRDRSLAATRGDRRP